jgi:hypothetical protein
VCALLAALTLAVAAPEPGAGATVAAHAAAGHHSTLDATTAPRVTTTNLPILRWVSVVPAAANVTALRITVLSGSRPYWDSGWLWRENPHQRNATTWPVGATTYAGPALLPATTYTWSVQERHVSDDSLLQTAPSSGGGTLSTAADLPTAAD